MTFYAWLPWTALLCLEYYFSYTASNPKFINLPNSFSHISDRALFPLWRLPLISWIDMALFCTLPYVLVATMQKDFLVVYMLVSSTNNLRGETVVFLPYICSVEKLSDIIEEKLLYCNSV